MQTDFNRTSWVIFACGFAAYLVLALVTIFVKGAWCDEGWYGAPAYELAEHGYLGTPNLYYGLQGVQQHTYWEMPGYIVTLALWMKVLGTKLVQARLLNVSPCGVTILLWFVLVRGVTSDRLVAALAAALIGVDQFIIVDAGWVRADMLGLLFQTASYVTFILLHKNHLRRALVFSFSFAAAAGLTHPNAGLLTVAGLLIIIWPDRLRLRLNDMALAAVPVIIAGLCWGTYIGRAPADFKAQFGWNSRTRFASIAHPLTALHDEIVGRYLNAYGLGSHDPTTPKLVIIRSVVLAAYWAATICVVGAMLRRKCKALNPLVGVFIAYALFYTLLEGTRTTYYLVWIVPLYCTFLAWVVVHLWRAGSMARAAAAVVMLAVTTVQAASTIGRALQYPRLGDFYRVGDYLKSSGAVGPEVIASSELGFVLGFDAHRYSDDETFGARAHIRPRRIVISPRFQQEVLVNPSAPEYAGARDFITANCTVSYDQGRYRVYECK